MTSSPSSASLLPPSGSKPSSSSQLNEQGHEQEAPIAYLPSSIPLNVGRVVRLHFSCHAELPIGSSLRVTGSTLWAPGTAAWDPAEATPAVGQTEASAFPVTHDIDADNNLVHMSLSALYTSSVEMVTTPEDYPIWKTKKPVVIVINNEKKSVQHHYYRYLVVSPGGSLGQTGGLPPMDGMDTDDDDEMQMPSTSNEILGSTPVLEWEDPFGSLADRSRRAETSSVSITSSIAGTGQLTKADYRNLPYRTLDIDVKTGNRTDEFRTDRWKMPDDVSFRPYRIREAVRYEIVMFLFLVRQFLCC